MHKKRIFKFFKATLCAALALSMVFGDLGSTLGISYAKQEVKQADKGQVEMDAKEQEMDVTEEEIAASNGLATSTKDGVILHAFCWSFKTIKENMKDIAEAGYTTVQTSPANACNDSYPKMQLWDRNQMENRNYDGKEGCWWWHYQPTDWTIGNYQLGT